MTLTQTKFRLILLLIAIMKMIMIIIINDDDEEEEDDDDVPYHALGIPYQRNLHLIL